MYFKNMTEHKNLEIIDIVQEEAKDTFKVFDEENQEIFNVVWRTMAYDNKNKEWIESKEVQDRLDKWSKDIFGLTHSTIRKAIGKFITIYEYDKFNSFWKVPSKFTPEMKGKQFNAEIVSVEEEPKQGIFVKYKYNDNEYTSKYNYTQWEDSLKKGFFNKDRAERAKKRFDNVFGEGTRDDLNALVGKTVRVQVKQAGKTGFYGEILTVI